MVTPLFAIKAIGGDPEDFQIYNGYWNDDSKPLIVGDWNHVGLNWNEYRKLEYGSPEHTRIMERDRRLVSLIEQMGYEIDWNDQIYTCDDCYKAVPTDEAICYDGEASCPDCQDLDSYIEAMQDACNLAARSDVLSNTDLEERGWRCLEKDLENGLHVGQDDNPKTFYEKYRQDWEHLLFLIERDGNPFTITFSLWGDKR